MNAQELIKYRERHRLRRSELSAILGMTPNAIWRWEHGDRRIPEWLPLFLALKDRERSLTMALVMRTEAVTIKKAAQG